MGEPTFSSPALTFIPRGGLLAKLESNRRLTQGSSFELCRTRSTSTDDIGLSVADGGGTGRFDMSRESWRRDSSSERRNMRLPTSMSLRTLSCWWRPTGLNVSATSGSVPADGNGLRLAGGSCFCAVASLSEPTIGDRGAEVDTLAADIGLAIVEARGDLTGSAGCECIEFPPRRRSFSRVSRTICARARANAARKSDVSTAAGSTFTRGWLRISLTRIAYRSVEAVSSLLADDGDTQAMTRLRELPPRESCSSRVSLDSR
jgi:hypothetical protein